MILLTVELANRPMYKPGQYFELRMPNTEASRLYSAVRCPESSEIRLDFGIQLIKTGELSPRLWDLRPGDKIEVAGPYGVCTLREEHAGPLVLIGAGSGIVPLLSIREAYQKRYPKYPIRFIVSAHSEAYVMWYELLKDEIILRCTSHEGRIDKKFLRDSISDCSNNPATLYYVVGSGQFVQEISNHLASLAIPLSSVRTESFF